MMASLMQLLCWPNEQGLKIVAEAIRKLPFWVRKRIFLIRWCPFHILFCQKAKRKASFLFWFGQRVKRRVSSITLPSENGKRKRSNSFQQSWRIKKRHLGKRSGWVGSSRKNSGSVGSSEGIKTGFAPLTNRRRRTANSRLIWLSGKNI